MDGDMVERMREDYEDLKWQTLKVLEENLKELQMLERKTEQVIKFIKENY